MIAVKPTTDWCRTCFDTPTSKVDIKEFSFSYDFDGQISCISLCKPCRKKLYELLKVEFVESGGGDKQ